MSGAVAAAPHSGRKVVLSSLAMGVSNAFKLAIQFAILPILARMLGPSAYGLVMLAAPFIFVSVILSDGGLGAGLARQVTVAEELESTVFWIATASGAGLSLVLCALAWPAALLIGEPKLAPVLMALSPILLMSGLLSVPTARLIRERRFGVFAIGDFLTTVLSAAAAFWAAFRGAGAWSLVIQQLVFWAVKAGWIIASARLRRIDRFQPSLARDHIKFGFNAAGFGLSEYASRNVDNFLIGVILGIAALGHYAIAYQVVSIPSLLITGPLYFSIFTAVARRVGQGEATHTLVLSCFRVLALATTPVFFGMALTADFAVRLALGPKWTAAQDLIVLLAPAGLLVCIYSFTAAVVMGAGRSERQFRLSLLSGVAIAIGVAAGSWFSVRGAAVGTSLGALVVLPLYLRALAQEAGLKSREVARAFMLPVAAGAVMALITLAVRNLTAGADDLTRLAAVAASGVMAYGAACAIFARRELRAMAPLLLRRRLAA